VPINRVRGYPGAYDNYAHLPDAVRWRQAIRFAGAGSTPPPDSIERATRHVNFHLHLGSTWTAAAVRDGRITTVVNGHPHSFDFVIAGTGYFADPAARTELAAIAPHIRLWRDQYAPPIGEESTYFGAHPYLGLAHEFLEKLPGTAPWLSDIHLYNPGGFVSFGLPIGDVPSIRRDVPEIVRRISRDLFLADLPQHEARMTGVFAPEFDEALYAGSIWRASKTQPAE
jgi:cation diffusion facilitator CzcD-associated flavoprotein CzcO